MPLRMRLELLWRTLGAITLVGATSTIIAKKSYARLRRARSQAVETYVAFLLCMVVPTSLVTTDFPLRHPAVLITGAITTALGILLVVRLRRLYVELTDLRTTDMGLFQNVAGPLWSLKARLGWTFAVLKARPRWALAVLRLATSHPTRYQTRADYKDMCTADLALHVILSQRRAYRWLMRLAICTQVASWGTYVATGIAVATERLLPHGVILALSTLLLAFASLACVSWAFRSQRETLKNIRISVSEY